MLSQCLSILLILGLFASCGGTKSSPKKIRKNLRHNVEQTREAQQSKLTTYVDHKLLTCSYLLIGDGTDVPAELQEQITVDNYQDKLDFIFDEQLSKDIVKDLKEQVDKYGKHDMESFYSYLDEDLKNELLTSMVKQSKDDNDRDFLKSKKLVAYAYLHLVESGQYNIALKVAAKFGPVVEKRAIAFSALSPLLINLESCQDKEFKIFEDKNLNHLPSNITSDITCTKKKFGQLNFFGLNNEDLIITYKNMTKDKQLIVKEIKLKQSELVIKRDKKRHRALTYSDDKIEQLYMLIRKEYVYFDENGTPKYSNKMKSIKLKLTEYGKKSIKLPTMKCSVTKQLKL